MARDWEATKTLADIENRMGIFGCNSAEYPLTMGKEWRNGRHVWVVMIHVKIRGITEFEIETEGTTLSAALRAAYLSLNSQKVLLARAARSNATFGVAV